MKKLRLRGWFFTGFSAGPWSLPYAVFPVEIRCSFFWLFFAFARMPKLKQDINEFRYIIIVQQNKGPAICHSTYLR